ncbi:MAG: sn-glycerol-3-phosphate ABC transporter ATP-binding protein UgpC [Gammaproteobacteria bacterium]|nr:sn-glycerol-3-phosphate ABC transporter ATP-binding protein UgpC [Gammaproteobacteria bacterium]
MAGLKLKHIYKVYDGGVKAVNDFSMDIEDKEFIVFVGPSGCGKSTTLRMIAGLEEISAGELMIGDEVVNDVEPKDRNIAMVFQNYALYPHMTVRENMAFALRNQKKFTEEEIMAKVEDAARKLDIYQFLERKPRALSGGQRQRVSLGRAIVRSPKVFLLDEPLSNLDAKLRAQMRTEISKLHKQLATTFIYVTHDQVEAMTMGTRIVVMKTGVIQQIDTPTNLYDYPGNKFVASFIGTPQMNFFEATLEEVGDKVKIKFAGKYEILVSKEELIKADKKYFDGVTPVIFGVRPEDVHIAEEFVKEHKDTTIECNTSIIEDLGSESILYCDLDEESESVETKNRLVLRVEPRNHYELGESIKVAIDPKRIHLFDKETEVSIMPRIPENNVLSAKVKGNKVDLSGVSFTLPEALKLEDGEYTFTIPSDAFFIASNEVVQESFDDVKYAIEHDEVEEKFRKDAFTDAVITLPHSEFVFENPKGDTEVKLASVEKVDKKYLLRLMFGESSVFAVSNNEVNENTESIKISIDFKRVKVERGEEVVKEPLNLTNVLDSIMIKERTTKNTFNFALKLEGKVFYTSDFIDQKLFNALSRKVFSTELECLFTPYDIKLSSDGIDAQVVEVLDYAKEKFAKVQVNEKEFIVFLRDSDKVSVGDTVKLALDLCTLGIIEKERGIRII